MESKQTDRPLAWQVLTPVVLSPQQYEKQIQDRDDIIASLFIALQAVRNNKYADLLPLLSKLIQERNELDRLWQHHMAQIEQVNHRLQKCEELTKHFTK